MAETCPVEAQTDHAAVIAALRERGAARFDPVRFRFIEALSRRAEGYRGHARNLLDHRLAEALQEYSECFEQAQGEAELAGDLESRCTPSPLAELAAYIAQRSAADTEREGKPDDELPANSSANSSTDSPAETSAELKSIRYFRDTWSKLSVDQQLAQALAQAPENAGPLNSHQLVLRAFQRMRDISPEYLHRFMSYVDALLWLDQTDSGKAATTGR
jgi:hypothetical protein